MERGHGNLQRDREEQLQLRGQLANVYDVIRDLGLHHKIEEIPGCSFITIGRSKHRFSHLDKNLTWTVPAVRGARDGVQYVEQNTVSTSEKDEAILSLHKSGQEQADEIARLNSLVTNLASGLQAANNLEKDEAEIKKNLTRKVQEQEEEMKKLNLQLLNQSSQPLAEKDESLLKLHEAALMQEDECARLNLQVCQLSLLLDTTSQAKSKSELLAAERGEQIEHLRERIDLSESLRLTEDNLAKQNNERHKEELFASLTALDETKGELSRASQEIEDKENKITAISDQNKGLNVKIAKIVKKAEKLQEDYHQAIQHNLTLKTAPPEAVSANEPKAETKNYLPQTHNLEQEEDSREVTDASNKHKDKSAESNDCQVPEDAISSQTVLSEFQVNLLNRREANRRETVDRHSDTIAKAVVDQFISAFVDEKFLRSRRGPKRFNEAVTRVMTSRNGLENIAAVIEEITRSVDKADSVSYCAEPDISLARALGYIVRQNLPGLMEILHDLEVFEYPWRDIGSYTRSEMSRILDQKQQFFAKTKEVCKVFASELYFSASMKKGFAHHTELEDMNALKSAEDTTSELEDMNALKSVKDTTTFPSEDFDENKSDEPNASDETEDNWNDWLSYQEGITRNWVDALAKKSDIIASELIDLFLSAFADTEFLISRDRLDYMLAVMREIMSDRGLDIMATTFNRITSTVENMDDVHISPDYTIMAEVLGGKVQLSLPKLMEVLRDDSVPYDIIAAIDEELSPVFENQLWANLQVLVEDFLEFLKTEALVALGSLKNPDDSDEDSDSFTSDSDELSSLEDFSTQLASTPYKNQGDKNAGKIDKFNEKTTDSGMGTSGILNTSAQTKTSVCKILEFNSSLSKLDGEASSQDQTVPGDEDSGEAENFNENATDSGMGTSGILTSSVQTENSECKIIETNSSLSNPDGVTSSQEQTAQENPPTEWGYLIHDYDEEWV